MDCDYTIQELKEHYQEAHKICQSHRPVECLASQRGERAETQIKESSRWPQSCTDCHGGLPKGKIQGGLSRTDLAASHKWFRDGRAKQQLQLLWKVQKICLHGGPTNGWEVPVHPYKRDRFLPSPQHPMWQGNIKPQAELQNVKSFTNLPYYGLTLSFCFISSKTF